MKRFLLSEVSRFMLCSAVLALLFCGGVWLLAGGGERELINLADLSPEFMEDYFASYAEMLQEGERENILIAMSYDTPDSHGAIDMVEAPNHTYYLMYDTAEARDVAYEALQNDGVVSVEKNGKMELAGYNSWGIEKMGLDKGIKAVSGGGESVKVAIIDTGLDVASFKKYYPNKSLEVYNVEAGSSDVADMVDRHSHGTHIAGTIAEGTPQNVKILAIRASSGEEDELRIADINTAIYRAISSGADVINLSLGGDYSESQKVALDSAKSSNIVAVAASGNENSPEVMYPAGYDNTISVAALDQSLERAVWSVEKGQGSNYNNMVDYAAPGTMIKSIVLNGELGYKNGTSMATPHVAAAVAILESYNNNLGLDAVNGLLREHVVDLGEAGKDNYYGYGMIDFKDAEFCDGGHCDEYGVFVAEAPVYAKMEVDEVTLTKLNYYSIQNLMPTEVKLYTDSNNYTVAKLQELDGLKISGYDAEAAGEQEVTISYGELSTVIKVTNPSDYVSGWEYMVENGEIILTKYTDVKDLDSDNEAVTRMYVPETIEGKKVVAIDGREETYTYYIDEEEYSHTYWATAFLDSTYASQYTEEVYLPETLTKIGERVFASFWNLKKVVMAANAVAVGEQAFWGDSKLKTVDGTISEVGEWAFLGDKSLKAITLAEGMTEISNSAFSGCTSLEEITIPVSVTAISSSAFYNDSALSKVEFAGDNLAEIGNAAFYGAAALTSITLPKNLEKIESNAFGYSGLTSIYVPASVTTIGDGAFSGCGDLETIVVAADNQKYYDVSNAALMEKEYGVTLIRGTKKWVMPTNTERIGGGAFSGITTAVSVMLPDSVKSIGYGAFAGCTGLVEVTIPKETYVEDGAFSRNEYQYKLKLDVKLKVYTDSNGYKYAVDNGFAYETLDASYALINKTYQYGDILSDDDEIEMYYNYGVIEDGEFVNHVDVDGKKIVMTVGNLEGVAYSGNMEYFRIGDTYFTAEYKDLRGLSAEVKVGVTVEGDLPEYEVPTGLTGKLRKYLSDVELPEGFSWVTNEYLGELGEHTYLATYTPGDAEEYAPIENIEIVVDVILGRERLADPEITLESKVYDGDWTLDDKYITIKMDERLSADDYYVHAGTWGVSGQTTAYVYIYLNNDAADEYGFGEDCEYYYEYYDDDYVILDKAAEVEVDNRADGVADVAVLEDGIAVTADKACVVIVTYDGGETYSRATGVAAEGEENKYKFVIDLAGGPEVIVALKGDGNLDGKVSSADSNSINRSLVSLSLKAYKPLTDLQKILLDLNGDGKISSADSNLVNRSLISPSLKAYKEIQW